MLHSNWDYHVGHKVERNSLDRVTRRRLAVGVTGVELLAATDRGLALFAPGR